MNEPLLDPQIALLLDQIDWAFDRKAWHGPNLRGSIRNLGAVQAAWRPHPDRHNIWEHVVHATYWKYSLRRRLLNEPKNTFPLKGSNWFTRPDQDSSDSAWKTDIQLLVATHSSLRQAILEFPSSRLTEIPQGSATTFRELIAGVAFHDVYHAGQIQLLKRLSSPEEQG